MGFNDSQSASLSIVGFANVIGALRARHVPALPASMGQLLASQAPLAGFAGVDD
jgi:hypothetical protein